MAKQKIVDNELLADAIREVEKNGPLLSLGDLYQAVTKHYNANRGKLDMLAPSFVMGRIKKLNFNTKTQPGKRGGGGGKRKAMNGENILLSLTDWEDKVVEVGKYVGTETKIRWILKFDTRQWILAKESVSNCFGVKYYCNFRCMLPSIAEYYPELKIRDCIPAIVDALYKRLNSVHCDEEGQSHEVEVGDRSLKEIGAEIDKRYDVNYFAFSTVRDRLLGRISEETEAETPESETVEI